MAASRTPAISADPRALSKKYEVQADKISDKKYFAEGGFAFIYTTALMQGRTERVVLKSAAKSDPKIQQDLRDEIKIMELLTESDAPNTVKLLGYFTKGICFSNASTIIFAAGRLEGSSFQANLIIFATYGGHLSGSVGIRGRLPR